MKGEVKRIYQNFLDALRTPELRILPGQLAFYILMSMIPIIAIISLVASILFSNFDLANVLSGIIPDALSNIIIKLVDSTSVGNVAFIIGCYIILGSNGPSAIVIASNAIYKIENKSMCDDNDTCRTTIIYNNDSSFRQYYSKKYYGILFYNIFN